MNKCKAIISFSFFVAATFLFSAGSRASNLYFGGNLNHSHGQHKIAEIADGGTPFFINPERTTTDSKNVGFGFNAGYKIDLNQDFYLAPEIFFDQLNNRSSDPASNDGSDFNFKQDFLTLNYRYGAQAKLGLKATENFSLFAIGGVTNVDYDINWNSLSTGIFSKYSSYGSQKIAFLYGIGLAYNISDKWTIQGSYDHQNFAIRYGLDGWRSKVELDVFKAGINYNF